MIKKDISPEELLKLRSAANIQSVLPDITDEIDAMERTTRLSVFEKLRSGTLTPQDALSYWMEIYSYHRLKVRMTTKASVADAITDTRRVTDGQA